MFMLRSLDFIGIRLVLDDVFIGNVDTDLVKSCSQLHFHLMRQSFLRKSQWSKIDSCHLEDRLLWVE